MTLHIEQENKWEHVGDTWVRGKAFVSGELLDTHKLGKKLDQLEYEDLSQYLSKLNGFYAAIKFTSKKTILISDHVRSWPLYYSDSEEILISDSSNWILNKIPNPDFDPVIATEYLFTSYATGDTTLSQKIHQTQAGEIVCISGDSVSQRRHYTYSPDFRGEKPTLDAFYEMCQDVIDRFVQIANGRTIVLGLSEGVDSRLLALLLAETEHDDIVAYTRGSSIPTGRKLANELGFDFVPVRITESDYREFYNSDEWDEFHRSVGFIDSLPQIKRYLVLDKLQQSESVPDDAIFTLGHTPTSACEWTTDEFTNQLTWSRDHFINNLNHPHLDHYRFSEDNPQSEELKILFEENIIQNLPFDLYERSIEPVDQAISGTVFHYWQEREPKYIMSNYEYDYFGYDRWYPFWDKECLEFWSQASPEDWAKKSLWTKYIHQIQPENWDEFLESDQDGLLRSMYHSSPQRLQHLIKPTYNFIKDPFDMFWSDGHVTDSPIFGLSKEHELQKDSLNYLHPYTFHYLLLYYDDYFSLEKDTELDLANSQ